MAKDRVITGFGPTSIVLSASLGTTSAWLRFGPFTGNQLVGQCKYSGSSNGQSVKLQAVLSTNSTVATQLMQIKSSVKTQVASTSALKFCFVRASSTALKAAGTATIHFAAVL